MRCYCDALDDYVDDLVAGAQRACALGIIGFPAAPEGAANPLADARTADASVQGAHSSSSSTSSTSTSQGSGGSRPAIPHFVLGASMGGCLATVASLKYVSGLCWHVLAVPLGADPALFVDRCVLVGDGESGVLCQGLFAAVLLR